MALYDGFFDAVFNEETMQYDRAYDSGAFVNYFEQTIGSGVCIHGNENSFLVRYQSGEAIVSPGYLFIQGYWLKNDADYSLTVSGAGTHAITAYLNTGLRMIELFAQPKADPEEYPDALVLAYVTIDDAGTVTVEDTRYRTDICGVIDSVGGLSAKVEYAINYIDNEIEGKLEAMEDEINAQSDLLDEKIMEVTALAEKLTPPLVGTVKFSASQDIEEGWLRCDGSFINEADYPELVAALGKKYPSGDKFSLLSDGEIGANISNPVIWNGRIWVYSHTEKMLYGVGLNGEETKAVTVSSDDQYFSSLIPSASLNLLCLSIITKKSGTGAKLCLCQTRQNTTSSVSATDTTTYKFSVDQSEFDNFFSAFWSDFTGEEDSVSLTSMFTTISGTGTTGTRTLYSHSGRIVPYVVSRLVNGEEVYCLCVLDNGTSGTAIASHSPRMAVVEVKEGIAEATFQFFNTGQCEYITSDYHGVGPQRYGFNPNNKDEAVGLVCIIKSNTSETTYTLYSQIEQLLFFSSPEAANINEFTARRTSTAPFTIVGENHFVADFAITNQQPAFGYFLTSSAHAGVVTGTTILPAAARAFPDAGSYLWGKAIYVFFVGTGLVFFRDPTNASDIGYLDTTQILGTITQFGYLRYSQDENTLYIVGQDSSNKVKIAKMVLNTLFDYANDGAWLPLIASDGIPAYIKAYETEGA